MEELNIPHLADSTLIGGSFQTPILEDITHGQRDNSRLFHTREDNSLPFHYYPKNVRKKKIMVSCSKNKFAKCKAKFAIISKNENNIIRCDLDVLSEKKKRENIRIFLKRRHFKRRFGMYTHGGECIQINVK